MENLYDMHCHLGFTPDPTVTARDGAALGIGALSCTVTPQEFEALGPALAGTPSVALALGAHPWWIADGRIADDAIGRFCALAPALPYIGEIGLDFAGSRAEEEPRRLQTEAFRTMLSACVGGQTPKTISIHAVQSAATALDCLEDAGALSENRCIFHWFSGTSDDLNRALRAGCFFSLSFRMLATKRGREYARQIPLENLLLETDAPAKEGSSLSAETWRAYLENAIAAIAQLKSCTPDEVRHVTAETSRRLLAY